MRASIALVIVLLLCLLVLGVQSIDGIAGDMEAADYAYFDEADTFFVRDFWIHDSWAYHSESKILFPYYAVRFYLVGERELESWDEYYERVYTGKPVGGSVPSERLIIPSYGVEISPTLTTTIYFSSDGQICIGNECD